MSNPSHDPMVAPRLPVSRGAVERHDKRDE